MKICFIANINSIHVVRWVNYFAENGWVVHVITWHPPLKDVRINDNICIHKILFPPHYIFRYFALLEVTRMIRKIKPHIINAHYISHFGIIGGMYRRYFYYRPLVLTAWGSDVLIDAKRAGRSKRNLIRRSLAVADAVTCDAEHIIQPLVDEGAIPEKIHLINFGIDTSRFSSTGKNIRYLKSLGIYGCPVVISTRQLRTIYSIGTLIRSIPLILKHIPDAKILIAGDGDERTSLEELAANLGVSKSTRFIGIIPNDKLPIYLNLADAYVSTSLSDAGLAASTAEAMSCEIPVVITDFGDNCKWVENGVSGFLIKMESSEELAEKIIQLLSNPKLRSYLGKKGREVIVNRMNRDIEMNKMESIYIELIKRYR